MKAKKIDFLTITKREYSMFQKRMVDKKIKFYTNKGKLLSPTIDYVYNYPRIDQIPLRAPPATLVDIIKKPISKQNAITYAKNIKIQTDAIKNLQLRAKYNYYCGLIIASTGAGKGNLIVDIVCKFREPTLILVTNIKLLEEMKDKFYNFSYTLDKQAPDIGLYGGKYKDLDKNITICTKKSFILHYEDFIAKFTTIIVDELHEGFSDLFRSALNNYSVGKQIALYGLTATPRTALLDTNDLEKYYGKKIVLELEDKVLPKVHFINYNIKTLYLAENYPELRTCLFEDKERVAHQMKIVDKIMKTSKCLLILSDRIGELEHYSSLLKDKYCTGLITGETKIKDDTALLDIINTSDKPYIILGSIKKVGTGFDFPKIDSTFIIASIKFQNTVIQSAGRCLRRYPGKEYGQVYVWNDIALKKQITEKKKAICKEWNIKPINIASVIIRDTNQYPTQVQKEPAFSELYGLDINIPKGKNNLTEAEFTTKFNNEWKKRGGFVHKLSDQSIQQKPFDAFYKINGKTYNIEWKKIKENIFNYEDVRMNQVAGLLRTNQEGDTSLIGVFSETTNQFALIDINTLKGLSWFTQIDINFDTQFLTITTRKWE